MWCNRKSKKKDDQTQKIAQETVRATLNFSALQENLEREKQQAGISEVKPSWKTKSKRKELRLNIVGEHLSSGKKSEVGGILKPRKEASLILDKELDFETNKNMDAEKYFTNPENTLKIQFQEVRNPQSLERSRKNMKIKNRVKFQGTESQFSSNNSRMNNLTGMPPQDNISDFESIKNVNLNTKQQEQRLMYASAYSPFIMKGLENEKHSFKGYKFPVKEEIVEDDVEEEEEKRLDMMKNAYKSDTKKAEEILERRIEDGFSSNKKQYSKASSVSKKSQPVYQLKKDLTRLKLQNALNQE